MYFRRSATLKLLLAAFFGAVIYCEFFIYIVQQQYWTDLECTDRNDHSCTKILFIADPQIQGDEAVSPPLSYLFNYDSDRYLKYTFRSVVKYFKPDVLVYLGDLMDEGSIATMPQFHNYVKRLSQIFEWDYPFVQVWVPGDNDIGGENEPIHFDKVKEFDQVFQQSNVVTFANVSFFKVNAITYSYPETQSIQKQIEGNFKIVVSHYPVTERQHFGLKIMNSIHPNIFFCAHEHESKYVTQNKDLSQASRLTTQFTEPGSTLTITFDTDTLYEVFVPTCSYRMGTNYIGYGAAVLENENKKMKYTVFWSPTRFPYLYLYAVVLSVLLVYSIVFCAARFFYRSPKFVTKREDMTPLMYAP